MKVKGLKNPVSFHELLVLLKKDETLEIDQNKLYKNIGKGYLTLQKEIYTLKLTENKRVLIFDKNNNFCETKPFILNNGVLTENN